MLKNSTYFSSWRISHYFNEFENSSSLIVPRFFLQNDFSKKNSTTKDTLSPLVNYCSEFVFARSPLIVILEIITFTFKENHWIYWSGHLIRCIKFKSDIASFWVLSFITKYSKFANVLTLEANDHTLFSTSSHVLSTLTFENDTFLKSRDFT